LSESKGNSEDLKPHQMRLLRSLAVQDLKFDQPVTGGKPRRPGRLQPAQLQILDPRSGFQLVEGRSKPGARFLTGEVGGIVDENK